MSKPAISAGGIMATSMEQKRLERTLRKENCDLKAQVAVLRKWGKAWKKGCISQRQSLTETILNSTDLLEAIYDLVKDVRTEVQRSTGVSTFGKTDRLIAENRLQKIEQGLVAIENNVEKCIAGYAPEFGIDPENATEPPSDVIKQGSRLRLVRRKSETTVAPE